MLGIGFPDRHALPHITPKKMSRPSAALPPARAGSFFDPKQSFVAGDGERVVSGCSAESRGTEGGAPRRQRLRDLELL